ncbi:MAG TPA: hypothetical protein DEB24_07425 [Coriobacteriia bacterium]|nr:hypothetical protein [Coriobacteriia bacterium]
MGQVVQKQELAVGEVTVMSELAYDANPSLGYTVYLEEAGALIPYLVLTDDYNDSGNTLLLRKHTMDEVRRYHPIEAGATSYYNGCEIDTWLSTEFVSMLSGLNIETSSINITVENTYGASPHRGETEYIDREVFLLSRGEVFTVKQ